MIMIKWFIFFFLAVEDEDRPGPQLTRFTRVDDLEDDFMMEVATD